jgi:hypothetical protein
MTTVGFDALPPVNAATGAKLLGISLAEFNRMIRDGEVTHLAGRRNAYSIADVIAAHLKHIADNGLSSVSEMARHLDLSPQRLNKLVDEGTLARPGKGGFERGVIRRGSPSLSTSGRPKSRRAMPAMAPTLRPAPL